MRFLLFLIALPSLVLAQEVQTADPRFLLDVGLGAGNFGGDAALPAEFMFTSSRPFRPPTTFPSTFDDDDPIERVSIAYRVRGGLFAELGYWDLGEYWPTFPALSCTSTAVCERVWPMVSVDQWSLGIRFDQALTRRFSGVWRLGIAQVDFGVSVLRQREEQPSFSFLSPIAIDIVGAPESETGNFLGVGLRWNVNDRIGVGAYYHRQDIQVGILETVDLSVTIPFWGQPR